MTSVIQTSLAAGELSPTLYARVDLEKFHVGAALLRNFFVDFRGGVSNRAGTQFVARTKAAAMGAKRLLPFTVSTAVTYVLEFGDKYLRFYTNSVQLTEAPLAITAATNASPGVFTSAAHGFVDGEEVYLIAVGGMTAINAKNYLVAGATTNTFTLTSLDGVPLDTTSLPAYTSGGTAAKIYELVTTYDEADLALLKFVQSADVLTITHQSYPPANLSRLTPSTFALADIVIGPKIGPPTSLAGVATNPSDPNYYGYVVTALLADGNEESLPSNTVVVQSIIIDAAADRVIKLSWVAPSGSAVLAYNVYKWGSIPKLSPDNAPHPTLFGYIGRTTALGFTDANIAPDFSKVPPEFKNPFSSSKNPACVTYFQQRRVYGAPVGFPETLELSQPGNFDNFNTTPVLLDTDAISISMASREVNSIKSMVAMPTGLVVFTSSGASLVTGEGQNGVVTPRTISSAPQSSSGANDVPPLPINYNLLYVQNKGTVVRDLAFDFRVQSYIGTDRSLLANHLFFRRQIKEWAFAQEPHKIVWVVLDNGALLSLTYVPEQEVYGWTRHDTLGLFQSVCSVSEGDEDAVYFVVERVGVQYVERLASRQWASLNDAWFVDAGLKYSGAPVTLISGLDHLAGQTVVGLADGAVVQDLVVSGEGTCTLPRAASSVILGLPYVAQLRTLYLEMAQTTVQGKMKNINAVTLRVDRTRGLKAGPTLDMLLEVKDLQVPYSIPEALVSSDLRIILLNHWNQGGQMVVEQSYPLPATILGLIPEVKVGDNAR